MNPEVKKVFYIKLGNRFLGPDDKFTLHGVKGKPERANARGVARAEIPAAVSFETEAAAQAKLDSLTHPNKKAAMIVDKPVHEKDKGKAVQARSAAPLTPSQAAHQAKRDEKKAKLEEKKARKTTPAAAKLTKEQMQQKAVAAKFPQYAKTQEHVQAMMDLMNSVKEARSKGDHASLAAKFEAMRAAARDMVTKAKAEAKARAVQAKAAAAAKAAAKPPVSGSQ